LLKIKVKPTLPVFIVQILDAHVNNHLSKLFFLDGGSIFIGITIFLSVDVRLEEISLFFLSFFHFLQAFHFCQHQARPFFEASYTYKIS